MDERDFAVLLEDFEYDTDRMTISFEDEGGERTEISAKYAVCDLCNGKGKHVNPSIDSGGLTREDFAEDPDFERDYFRGLYDISCNRCGGKRVILVAGDENNKEDLAGYERALQERHQSAVDRANELRYGF